MVPFFLRAREKGKRGQNMGTGLAVQISNRAHAVPMLWFPFSSARERKGGQ